MTEKHSKAKERLLLTATDLFWKDGFHVGIDRIILDADVAKMSLYRHFPSKDDLVLGVLDRTSERLTDYIRGLQQIVISKGIPGLIDAGEQISAMMCDSTIRGGLLARAVVDFPEGNVFKQACRLNAGVLNSITDLCRLAGAGKPRALADEIFAVSCGSYFFEPLFSSRGKALVRRTLEKVIEAEQRLPSAVALPP
jgi:AcrR family transcriptional regulator